MKKTLIQRADVTESLGRAAIEFTNISGSYTDLYLVASLRSDRSGNPVDVLELEFNGDSTNRSSRRLYGNSSAADSGSFTNGRIGLTNASTATSNSFGSVSIHIANYASSNAKSVSVDNISENNSGAANYAFQEITAFLWDDSAAITSVKLIPQLGTVFVQYSSASLYGITAGNDGITTVS